MWSKEANFIKTINSLKLSHHARDLRKSRGLLGKTLTPGNHVVLLELPWYKNLKLSWSALIAPLKQEYKKTVLVMKEMILASPSQVGSRRVQTMAIFGWKTHREPCAMI